MITAKGRLPLAIDKWLSSRLALFQLPLGAQDTCKPEISAALMSDLRMVINPNLSPHLKLGCLVQNLISSHETRLVRTRDCRLLTIKSWLDKLLGVNK